MSIQTAKSEFKTRRRDAIVSTFADAAEATIAAKGYEGATMHDIAREAGCACGTLYLYFKSKEELFNAMVTKHVVALTTRFCAAMNSRATPLEKMRLKTVALLDYFNEHRAFFRIFYTVGPGGHLDVKSKLHESALDAFITYKKLELKVIRQAQKSGALRRDLPAEELQEFIGGVTITTLARWSNRSSDLNREQQLAILWGLLMNGLGA